MNRVLGSFGYELRRRRRHLKGSSGFKPERLALLGSPATVIDVGVARGTRSLYAAFPDARLVLVEPLADVFRESLDKVVKSRRGVEVVQSAAGSAPGRASIHYFEDFEVGASLLERSDLTRATGERRDVEVPVERLDEIVSRLRVPGPYGLKIDTEGYELEVLNGADGLFDDLEFVIAEVSVLKRFKGSYTFSELIRYMDDRAFAVTDLLDYRRVDAVGTRFLDLVFVPVARL